MEKSIYSLKKNNGKSVCCNIELQKLIIIEKPFVNTIPFFYKYKYSLVNDLASHLQSPLQHIFDTNYSRHPHILKHSYKKLNPNQILNTYSLVLFVANQTYSIGSFREFNSVVGTIYSICKVRSSNSGHHKKNSLVVTIYYRISSTSTYMGYHSSLLT